MLNNLRSGAPTRLRTHFVALVVMAACLAALGGASAMAAASHRGTHAAAHAAKPPSETIGYVDINSSGAMQKRWYHFFTTATKLLGWKVVLDNANGVPATGLTDVRNLISQGVNAIVVSCIDTSTLHPALVQAKHAGIPTIALGCQNGPPTGDWSATYAESDPALARFLAAYVVKYLKAHHITSATVLQDRTLLIGRLRSDYFISALRKAGIKLVSTPVIPETSIDPSTTTAVDSALSADPHLGAIIPVFDFSVGPTVAALASQHATHVSVFSYYADQVNLPLMIKAGSPIKGLVDGPVEQVSLVAVDQLLRHFVTHAAINPSAADRLKINYTIFTPSHHPKYTASYVTPWNVDSYLAPYVHAWDSAYHYKLSVPKG